jgi:hypothetical protein
MLIRQFSEPRGNFATPYLTRTDDGDFHAWLRDAEPEEIVAIMARAMNCLVKRGLSDADVKRGLESLASQIDRIRNPQLVN